MVTQHDITTPDHTTQLRTIKSQKAHQFHDVDEAELTSFLQRWRQRQQQPQQQQQLSSQPSCLCDLEEQVTNAAVAFVTVTAKTTASINSQ